MYYSRTNRLSYFESLIERAVSFHNLQSIWNEVIADFKKKVIGKTEVKSLFTYIECKLKGLEEDDLITNAMLYDYRKTILIKFLDATTLATFSSTFCDEEK